MSNPTMKAYVLEEIGGPEALIARTRPRPTAIDGHVLIAVRAFGLNRSEWFTRRGDSPSVELPRVLGIEAVGEVVEAPGTDLKPGQTVAAMMGGMGRDFDGSYAEFTVVPAGNVFALATSLPWEKLAALPEMLQTTHGSLYQGLEIDRAENLLIRGGTSSVGYAALALAKAAGLSVTSTSRSLAKESQLREAGADHVIVDDGAIAERARALQPGGYDRVLELIGATTLLDSLAATRRGGIVCMTGILGGSWALPDFHPMGHIPTAVKLTSYAGESSDITAEQLQHYVTQVETGALALRTGPVFPFAELVDAHRLMDANKSGGKIVIKV
ncbi:MAG: zinc-binding alcohol dehydrogenase family protein [Myxococcota bacterium]